MLRPPGIRELVCRHGEEGWDRARVAAAVYSTAHHSAAGEGLLLLAACQLPHTITDYILLTRGTGGIFCGKTNKIVSHVTF